MKQQELWLAGQDSFCEDCGIKAGFTLIGIFDTIERAKQACSNKDHFIARWELNLADLDTKELEFEIYYQWPFEDE